MITTLLTLAMLGVFGSSTVAHQPAAQRTRCQIAMTSWCITMPGPPVRVNMIDLPNSRLWSIKTSVGMSAGPLIIISSKACSDRAGDKVIFAGRMQKKNMYGWPNMNSAVFMVGSDGCELKFIWPSSTNNSFTYLEFMLYRILIGEHKDKLLYKFYDKVRCNGKFVPATRCPYSR